MASVGSSCELPNLKIEIDNYMGEPMETEEVDNNSDGKNSRDDAEEGEISDSKDFADRISPNLATSMSPLESVWEKRYENKGGGFLTGVDIFDEREQSKLGERAIRFGLNPSEVKTVSEEQLKALYKSLGVRKEDGKEEKHFRLNSLHMRGTENMSTQDIFSYFKDYGPASIEWINDYTCNVVWLDEISAARAVLGLSKEIKGLKPVNPKKRPLAKEIKVKEAKDAADNADDHASVADDDNDDDSDDEEDDDEDNDNDNDVDLVVVDQIRSKEGEIIMIVDEIHDKDDDTENSKQLQVSNSVDASDITIPIPPGLWRKGVDCPKAKCILLRFSTQSDKKLPRAERLSDYYKRHGNPNYGGIRGLITPSRKRRYRRSEQSQIFDDDLGDGRDFRNADESEDSKNPWGNLARSWSNIDKNRGKKKTDRYYADSPPRKMTPPPSPLFDGAHHTSILKRLGTSSTSSNISLRFQPEGYHSDEDPGASKEDDREWTRRSKIPRMRMYADEEQVRVQRRKAIEQSHSRRQPKSELRESRSEGYVKEVGRTEGRNRENISKSREGSKHVSRSRARSREDLRSRLGKDSRGHSGKKGSSNSSTTASSKWGRISHKSTVSRSRLDSNEVFASKKELKHVKRDTEDEDSDIGYADLRDSLRSGKQKRVEFDGEDLRSKLNFKKNLKESSTRQKSPLRIEIDNDEYYRLIGSD